LLSSGRLAAVGKRSSDRHRAATVGVVSDGGNAVFRNIERRKEAHLRQATKVLFLSDPCRHGIDLLPREFSLALRHLRDPFATNPCPPT